MTVAVESFRGLTEWPDTRLFDAWYLTDAWIPRVLKWPQEMEDYSSTDKERWGVLLVKRAIFEQMEGARMIHRGDAPVWGPYGDCSYLIQGDLDVAWEGRSPIFEVKTYLPAVRLRGGRAPACQGLDFPRRQDYLNEQKISGRPFYVLWVWADPDIRHVIVRGKRVDLLEWPAPESSANRLSDRSKPIRRMVYWPIDSLDTVAQIAADVEKWNGQPFQEALL